MWYEGFFKALYVHSWMIINFLFDICLDLLFILAELSTVF